MKRTWRALSAIATAHEQSRGFKVYGPGEDCFGQTLNHLLAFWYW